MAEQDIRENAMSGGTPARLRGLAANGNSISPTIQEVMNAMEIYIFNLTLAAGEEKDLGDLGTVCICLHPPTMQQLLFIALERIRNVLYQMEGTIYSVIILMGLRVLFSVEKRQMVISSLKTTEALKHP